MDRQPTHQEFVPSNASIRVRFVGALEAVRQGYGFVPAVMVILAACLAGLLISVDEGQDAWSSIPWLNSLTAESARSILGTIAGSSITVAGTVFSILIVALTLASSQFGPRLLRTFLRDRGSQLALGTFVATFMYALLVLASVRADSVPRIATAGAVVLAIAGVVMLVFVLHRSSTAIQAASLIAEVSDEITRQIERLPRASAAPEARPEEFAEACAARPTQRLVFAPDSGSLRGVDLPRLTHLMAEADGVFETGLLPGDFVLPGAPLGRMHVREAPPASGELDGQIAACFSVGAHRNTLQDHRLLIDQLVEMALRALSPGINDPATATACLHRLGAALCGYGARPREIRASRGPDGAVRVWRPTLEFEQLVTRCLDPLRRAGIGQLGLVAQLFHTVAEVARQQLSLRGPDAPELAALRTFGEALWIDFERTQPSARDRGLMTPARAAFVAACETL